MHNGMEKGSWVPIVTPFTSKNEIDFQSLTELIEWHIAEGTDGIVCLGTTGEAPTLSKEEKLQVIQTCLQVIKGRIPLIVGTGTNNTAESVAFTKVVKDLQVDGALVIFPYYNKPSFKGCLEHFRVISKVGVPIMLYYNPGRSGFKLPLEIFIQMEKEKLIHSIKDSSSEMQFSKQLRKSVDLPIFSGDDIYNVPILKEGATGIVGVVTNLFPKEWKEVVNLFLMGKFKEGSILASRFDKLLTALSLEVNPTTVKYTLSLMGKCSPYLRLPLVEPEDKTKERIQKALTELMKPTFSKGHVRCDEKLTEISS